MLDCRKSVETYVGDDGVTIVEGHKVLDLGGRRILEPVTANEMGGQVVLGGIRSLDDGVARCCVRHLVCKYVVLFCRVGGVVVVVDRMRRGGSRFQCYTRSMYTYFPKQPNSSIGQWSVSVLQLGSASKWPAKKNAAVSFQLLVGKAKMWCGRMS